jgi:hypothetical protein
VFVEYVYEEAAMSLAEMAPVAPSAEFRHAVDAGVARGPAGRCPFHSLRPDAFDAWLEQGLQCAAGRREFKLGRYFISRFRNGADYLDAFAQFQRRVADESKTGFLALLVHDEAQATTAADELKLLGQAMVEAGLAPDAERIIRGETIGTPIEVICPVTGVETQYEFFSVAFTRNALNPNDPLYDPSLGAPFTAINTTCDAYAFARLVHDQAQKAWGRAPWEMVHDRDALELLFRKCVIAWQNMSVTTISNYSRTALDPSRGVHLAEDRKHWFAAHNDPVFAEMTKCPHMHEMPVTYAARLCAKWSANLFDGEPYVPTRDGQSGGIPVLEEKFEVEGYARELFKF